MRVVIAEDHYLVREGLRRLLEDSGEVEVVACVGTVRELLDAVKRLGPDAVVTDIRMPPDFDVEGIEAARQIRAERPRVGVVVLSQYSSETYAYRLLAQGSQGVAYLLKERVGDLAALLRALNEVIQGGSVVDPVVLEALFARRARQSSSPLRYLTPRERDVLRAMAEGDSNAAIASHLSMSESAVEKHISNILGKLQLTDELSRNRRVAAVLTFLRESEQ